MSLCGLDLDRPRIMGILNVTPDSFSDGGTLGGIADAVRRGKAMVRDGADILDIGGESTRPGAATVPVDEETTRVIPVIRALRDAGVTTPISVDTRKAGVARAALVAGADMVNDVTALRFDFDMAAIVAEAGCPVCLMHSKGEPATMQEAPSYADVTEEVLDHLRAAVDRATAAGIARDRIVVDPGIGFGKTQAHNLTLLRDLDRFGELNLPVLLGASRKGFIGAITGVEVAADRLAGSLAVMLHGVALGARILRVHDVAQTRQALAMWQAIEGAKA